MSFNNFTPSELILQKDKVFTKVAEDHIAANPGSPAAVALENVLVNTIKVRKPILKEKARKEKRGRK